MPTTCTPQSIYGPYYQTRFCGASIMNFTVTAGWNEQTSELTVNLVEDCSIVNKRIQYGVDLEASIVTDADEFSEPPVGCPVYFRVGDIINADGEYERNYIKDSEGNIVVDENGKPKEGGFEFSGLIQSWNRKNDTNGNPAYTVKITDPRVILENSHIVISELSESVFVSPPDLNRGLLATPNIINAYAWLEALGRNCAMETIGGEQVIGSLTGGFGISGVNERGMRWNTLKGALAVLLCSSQAPVFSALGVSSDPYSPEGRLLYRGGGTKVSETTQKPLLPGCGVLGPTPLDDSGRYARYMVDLTEIPFAPEHYRITGPLISFTELITQVCKAAGCDYYVELLPVKGLTGINLVIKVRVVKRSLQPALGEISRYVDAQDFVVSKTFGHELAGQSNSSFIFGAPRQDYIQQTRGSVAADLNIIPHPGWDTLGIPQIVTYDNLYGAADQWWWYLDFRKINHSTLNTVFPANFGWVSETELRCILGTYDVWIDYEVLKIDESSETPLAVWLESLLITRISGPIFGSAVKKALSVATGGGGTKSDPLDNEARDAINMFEWLRTFAQEYYGKKFLVKVPNVCRAYNYEQPNVGGYQGAPYYSDDPASDGGWPQTSNVLGLTKPSAQLDLFAADDGKILPILKFYDTSVKLVTADLEEGSFTTAGNTIWAKCDVEEKWLVGNPYALWSLETAWAQLTVPGMVTAKTGNTADERDRALLSKIDPSLGKLGPASSGEVGGESKNELAKKQVGFISDPGSLPIQGGVPVKSNTRCYGPWGNIAIASTNNDLFNPQEPVAGNLHAENDDSLSPWGYGSATLMDEAGKSQVKLTTTEMQVVERGQVTVPGYPNKRIGSALNTSDTSSYDMFLTPDNYREFVFFKVDLVGAAGLASNAASISTVNVSISTQGVQTEYALTTFTPVYGRFTDANASRLKRIGQNYLAAGRARRAMAARRSFLSQSAKRAARRSEALFGGRNPHSSVLWFAGKMHVEDAAGAVAKITRSEVVANDGDAQSYYGASFDVTAMMSFDGLLRPISKYGGNAYQGGRLPGYTVGGSNCAKSRSTAPPPPHKSYSAKAITTWYLDPMANTAGSLQPIGPANYSAGVEIGHDVDEVARGTLESIGDLSTGNSGSIDMRHGEVRHTKDYRFLALKGPLVLQGWGYDMHGHPIPNNGADTDAIGVSTSYESCDDAFKEGFLQDPSGWPVAPVDLKYDRERGVWAADPGYRMYEVSSSTDIDPGSTVDCTVNNDGDVADDAKSSDVVEVYNNTCVPIPKNCNFLAYYDTVSCKYWPIAPSLMQVKDYSYCEWNSSYDSCNTTKCIGLGWGLEIEDYKQSETKIRSPFYVTTVDYLPPSIPPGSEGSSDGNGNPLSMSLSDSNPPSYPSQTSSSTANEDTLTNQIEVGRGLSVTREDCKVTLEGGIGIGCDDTVVEGCDGLTLNPIPFDREFIVFGANLNVKEMHIRTDQNPDNPFNHAHGKKGVIVSAVTGGGEGSISCDVTTDCSSSVGCPSSSMSTIEWGIGLEVQSPTTTTAAVHKKLSIEDGAGGTAQRFVNDITLGCGLKVVGGGGCGGSNDDTDATISITNDADYNAATDEVKVVCDITCGAQGLEVIKKIIVFSACGLYMGTKRIGGALNDNGDGSTSIKDVGCQKAVSSDESLSDRMNFNSTKP